LIVFMQRRGSCTARIAMKLRLALLALPLAACTNNPNDVMVQLAPEVISSLDGTLQVHAIALADNEPQADKAMDVTIAYTDRNGMAHAITPASGKTDKAGAFDTTFQGLMWDGSGTVTATIGSLTGTATFAVLDRTPPKVTITPPAAVPRNTDVNISVHVTDEIGVSQVFFDTSRTTNGNGNRDRATITTGAGDITVQFTINVPDAPGTMITLYALGQDMSGNQAAAAPVTVTVQ
jgi:hypothetical protein